MCRRISILYPTVARSRDAQGFSENQPAAKEGGKIAGNARQELERKTRRKVVSSDNYLEITGKTKKLKDNSKPKKKLK